MLNIHLKMSFQLNHEKQQEAFPLTLKETGEKKSTLSFQQFLKDLPFQPTKRLSLTNPSFKGHWYRESYRNCFALLLSGDETLEDLFRNFDYHQYDALEEDLTILNPNYQFVRKTGPAYNLKNYLTYFQEALGDMSVSALAEWFSFCKQPLSFTDFVDHFVCLDPDEATYYLPFRSLKTLTQIDTLNQVHQLQPEPYYMIRINSDHCFSLYMKNNMFYLLLFSPEGISHHTFLEGETLQLEQLICEQFQPTQPLDVFYPGYNTYSYPINTQLDYIDTLNNQTCHSFSKARQLFKECYNVKAPSKELVYQRAKEAMKNEFPDFPVPFFINHSTPPPHAPVELNKEHKKHKNNKNLCISDFFRQTDSKERNKLFFEFLTFSSGSVIEKTNLPQKHMEIMLGNQSIPLYIMPDYENILKELPTFNELIR